MGDSVFDSTNLNVLSDEECFLDLLSMHFLICNEKIPGKGEDSGYEAYTVNAGILGAFDGCGGMGSKLCEGISNKTEAYIASRVIAGTVRKWFYENCESMTDWDIDALKESVLNNLSFCRKHAGGEGLKLRGSLIKSFPSTMAMVLFRFIDGRIKMKHVWAGDSRTYIIDEDGLGQISVDDIKDEDAMSNLSKDGALTNVISEDGNFVLHTTDLFLQKPGIVFASSDGCFGYVSSPMEFELMILSTLVNSENVEKWRQSLNESIYDIAGDDQTIAIAAFGFQSFLEMKDYFRNRYEKMQDIAHKFQKSDSGRGLELWEEYKPDYYRYAAKKHVDEEYK